MNLPARVLIFIEDGSFTFDNRVKREVLTLEREGYKVSIICPRYPGEKYFERIAQTHVYRYRKFSLGGPIAGHMLEYACSLLFGGVLSLWIAIRHGFNVIHLCNPPDFLFPIAGFFKMFGKRFIFDHHDLCPELFETQYGKRSGSLFRILCWAERRSLHLADVVISTNETYRRVAMERGRKSTDAVFVVRNGPLLETFASWPQPRMGSLCASAISVI